jgi:hypothetical protein
MLDNEPDLAGFIVPGIRGDEHRVSTVVGKYLRAHLD